MRFVQRDKVVRLCGQCLCQDVGIRLVRNGRGRPGNIVLPRFGDRRGHPAAYSAAYADEILALGPENSLRDVLARHPSDVLEVRLDDAGILEDMDTPDEYEKALDAHRS